MKLHALLFCLFSTFILAAQQKAPVLSELKLEQVPAGKVSHYWLQMGEDAFGQAILVPVIVAKGNEGGPALGLTAAIHGNELNGIAVIHEALARLDLATLKGSVIAIPGLNPPAIFRNQREFPDGQDLKEILPVFNVHEEVPFWRKWGVSEQSLDTFWFFFEVFLGLTGLKLHTLF